MIVRHASPEAAGAGDEEDVDADESGA